MTPKEKALQLVEQFSLVGLQQREEGIACALIAVDEILLAIDWHEYEYPNEQFEYWHEVRTEIENL
jgi:hypothetical protein